MNARKAITSPPGVWVAEFRLIPKIRSSICAATVFLSWILVPLLLCGCAHAPNRPTPLDPATGNAHLLYLHALPHRSLHVEVDAVQGTEPSDIELNKLQTFLQRWCDKPDGITVVRSSVIPRSKAAGRSATSLAREYQEGPSIPTKEAQAAYLYVLFYDNRINRNPTRSPRAESQWPITNMIAPRLAEPENPHVVFPYPAMIYVDRSWLNGLVPLRYRSSVNHEAAHVLGLVRRDARVKNMHCPTKSCCMASVSDNISSDLLAWLTRGEPSPEFCAGCTAELQEARDGTNAANAQFVGAVLVTRKPGYHVLTLPAACHLYIGDNVEQEARKFFSDVHSETHGGQWLSARAEPGQSRALQAVEAAKSDPLPIVRHLAERLEEVIRSEDHSVR